MRLEQMLWPNSQTLPLQTRDALNEQTRQQNQHQRHSHFRHDQKIADPLSGTARTSGAAALL